jgi:hypothetical protein
LLYEETILSLFLSYKGIIAEILPTDAGSTGFGKDLVVVGVLYEYLIGQFDRDP